MYVWIKNKETQENMEQQINCMVNKVATDDPWVWQMVGAWWHKKGEIGTHYVFLFIKIIKLWKI